METQKNNKPLITPLAGLLFVYFLIVFFIILKEVQPFLSPKAILHQPQTAQNYYMLGKQYLSKRQFDKSIEMSYKALALEPRFGAAYIIIGLDYAGQGQFDKAIEYYNKALPLLAGDKYNLQLTYHNIGIMYDRKKDDQKAWEYFHKAYELGAYKDPYLKSKLDPRIKVALESNKYQGFKKAEHADKYALPSEIQAMTADFIKDVQLGKAEDVIQKCNNYLKQNPTTPYLSAFKQAPCFCLFDRK